MVRSIRTLLQLLVITQFRQQRVSSFRTIFDKRREFFSKATMQNIRSDGIGGRGVTYIPTSGSYQNVVVWMHGLGDTADGWASLMPSLGLKDTKFILPTANSRPITINGGMKMPGWSDIYGLDTSSPEDKNGFNDSAERINRIVQAEIDKEIKPQNIVVAGFSQGGALALHVALRSEYQLGGCIALSTWLPFRNEYPAALSPNAQSLNILQIHGDEDMVVSHNWGKTSNELLSQLLRTTQFHTIEGMGHSSDPEEIMKVSQFLKNVFKQ